MCAHAYNRTKIENKTENGKRKAENFCFSIFAWSWKTDLTHEARAEAACRLCLARRKKSLRSGIKAESGKT